MVAISPFTAGAVQGRGYNYVTYSCATFRTDPPTPQSLAGDISPVAVPDVNTKDEN